MAGLSPAHLLIILIIALIVVGPGKLPELGAALGKSLREFQKATGGITDALTTGVAVQPQYQTPVQQPPAPQTAAQPLALGLPGSILPAAQPQIASISNQLSPADVGQPQSDSNAV
jgi:sec-independent protein translocase protein TatA